MKRIFIGGTGRSGTTILQHIMWFHEELYTIPIETKFIVQTDGLYSLVQHLTEDFSIADAPIAISRFKQLMYDVITHTGSNPYEGFTCQPYDRLEYVPQEIFPDYEKKLDTFFSQIENKCYNRAELLKIGNALVESLFGTNAISRNALGWVEKTPSNVFRIEFLYEMFPDAIFINCIRDPRGVLDSFMRKEWLSGTIEDCAKYFVTCYAYLAKKREFGKKMVGQYYEIRLEDLVKNPVEEMSKLLEFIEVSPFNSTQKERLQNVLQQGSIIWSAEKNKFCDTWERDFSVEVKESVTTILKNAIIEYGYDPTN